MIHIDYYLILMDDREFIETVQRSPKLFTGFSDTTINHFMFWYIGMQTFYRSAFICDLGESGKSATIWARSIGEMDIQQKP